MKLILLISLLWPVLGLCLPLASQNSMAVVGFPSQILAMHRIGTIALAPDEQVIASKKVTTSKPAPYCASCKLTTGKINAIRPRSHDLNPELLQETLERDPNKTYPYVLRVFLRKAMPTNQSANAYALEFAESKHVEIDLENVFRMDKLSVFMLVQITPTKVTELKQDPRVSSLCQE